MVSKRDATVEYLLELGCEEIPPHLQQEASQLLGQKIVAALGSCGVATGQVETFWGPRRLTVYLAGLPRRTEDHIEERKGPHLEAPQKAIDSFLEGVGISSILDARIQQRPIHSKKPDYYFASVLIPGQEIGEILARIVPEVLSGFSWVKAMRWGHDVPNTPNFRWIRPIRNICSLMRCSTWGSGLREVPVNWGRLTSNGYVFGRETPRGVNLISLTNYAGRWVGPNLRDRYVDLLRRHRILVDAEERMEVIRNQISSVLIEGRLSYYNNADAEILLEEVANLVEWPVALVGELHSDFLEGNALPDRVTHLILRDYHRCLALRDTQTGELSRKFVIITDNVSGDLAVVGYERAVNVRLRDAASLWRQDQEKSLSDFMSDQVERGVVFHEKIGSMRGRVSRIARLAQVLLGIKEWSLSEADLEGARGVLAWAAWLAKADLATATVREFPELQGYIGGILARAQGSHPPVVEMITQHYKPQGPKDSLPSGAWARILALADKLDLLISFWCVGEKGTGSRDPFGLRRAASGVIRLARSFPEFDSAEALLDLVFSWNRELAEEYAELTQRHPGGPKSLEEIREDLSLFFERRSWNLAHPGGS